MSELQFNPADESIQYWDKIQRGMSTLSVLRDEDVVIASTPKEVVYCNDKTTLYRYQPRVERRVSTPLLIVYSQVGRYTMVDLQPDRSVVGNLLDNGIDVYLIDWGTPNLSDRWIQFDDYVEEYLGGYVDFIRKTNEVDDVSLLGICEGGVFTTCYAALNPQKVRNLALAVTPIDFHADQEDDALEQGYLNRWVRNLSPTELEDLIDSFGQMPGDITGMIFQEMTPVKSLTKYNVDLADSISGSREQVLNFLRMEKWLSDRPHHPGEAAKTWLIDLYKKNQLINKQFSVDGRIVDLSDLTMPVLNIFANKDHIVPPPTSKALGHHVGTEDYKELALDVGHIGTFVSRKANQLLTDTLTEWLAAR